MMPFFSRNRNANRILEIGYVTPDLASGKKLKDLVAKRDQVGLRLIESKAVVPGYDPDGAGIFVYDLNISSSDALKEFARFMNQRPQDIPVIVLAAAVNDELVRWFLRLRVSDWVKTPLTSGELIATCGRVISQSLASRQEVKCMTFIGARGGVGTTTIAVHAALAHAAATRPAETTCLVDLDLVSGSCAEYLDLKASWQLDELIENPARLDDHMLDILTTKHGSGLAVISAQRRSCERFTFEREVITRTLDLATQRYKTLIIDMPRHAERWTGSVLQGSTDVFVVTDFSVPGLRSARRMIADMISIYGSDLKPKVIVNKHTKTMFGTGLSTSEAKELLRVYLAGYVSADERLAREAIDRGVPTTEIKRRNAIVTDLAKILGV